MRAWRALKASGAAVLRDGVYLLPNQRSCPSTFDTVAADVIASGGSAYVLSAEEPANSKFQEYFNRDSQYAALLEEINKARAELNAQTVAGITKQTRKLRKNFAAIADTDFFPGPAQNRSMPRWSNWRQRSIASFHPMNLSPVQVQSNSWRFQNTKAESGQRGGVLGWTGWPVPS